MNVHGYTRINQTPLTQVNERLIILRKSDSIINDLLVRAEIDSTIEALTISKEKIQEEIKSLTSRLTIRS